jgi:hypothetical protein
VGFKVQGKYVIVANSYIYQLDVSSPYISSISNDDLAQFAQFWVIDTAYKSKQEAAETIYSKVKERFAAQNVAVFVWDKGAISMTETKCTKGWALFKW